MTQATNGWRQPLGVGRDNAILLEPPQGQEKCLKTRRIPQVGFTHCWAIFIRSSANNNKIRSTLQILIQALRVVLHLALVGLDCPLKISVCKNRIQ